MKLTENIQYPLLRTCLDFGGQRSKDKVTAGRRASRWRTHPRRGQGVEVHLVCLWMHWKTTVGGRFRLSPRREDVPDVYKVTRLARRAVSAARPTARPTAGQPAGPPVGSVTDDDRRQTPASKIIYWPIRRASNNSPCTALYNYQYLITTESTSATEFDREHKTPSYIV